MITSTGIFLCFPWYCPTVLLQTNTAPAIFSGDGFSYAPRPDAFVFFLQPNALNISRAYVLYGSRITVAFQILVIY